MGDHLVALGHFHLAEADGAAGAEWHAIVGSINQPAIVTFFQEAPDGVVVGLGHGEIAAAVIGWFVPVFWFVPIHPVTEPNTLICLDPGKFVDACLAQIDELIDGSEGVAWDKVLDIFFAFEAEFFFDFDLDPKALAIEAVLIAEFVALHGVVALEGIFVGAAPGVMDTHWVVGGDGAIEK